MGKKKQKQLLSFYSKPPKPKAVTPPVNMSLTDFTMQGKKGEEKNQRISVEDSTKNSKYAVVTPTGTVLSGSRHVITL